MKKVITSFGTGYHSRLLSLSIPTLQLYAQNHQYDLFVPSDSFFSETTKQLPPAWWKIDIIQYLLKQYDRVLWIDADVIICRFENDISESLDNSTDFGLVVHETPDGQIPNSGVWLLNPSCLNWLEHMKSYTHFKRSECWWEQAALLHLMGINPDDSVIKIPEKTNLSWTSLDYYWNPHINDNRKIPEDTRFFHATCYHDRYAVMKNILKQIDI